MALAPNQLVRYHGYRSPSMGHIFDSPLDLSVMSCNGCNVQCTVHAAHGFLDSVSCHVCKYLT